MKYKSNRIGANEQFRYPRGFILGAIRQFDVFISCAREVVFANIYPSICDIKNIREDGLVQHNLIRLTRVTNGIDRTFCRCSNRRDANIHGINSQR